MARPSKNNAEYFSHDADMRNNRKVKALRRRFSHKGYAVWCFILETLTDADYFEIKFDEVTQDLLAADFDITNEELQSIVAYCVKIRLLQMKDDTLYCEALKQRFSGLIEKRRYDYERYLRYKKKAKSVSDTESKINEVKTNENEDFHREKDVEIDNEDKFHRENSTVKYSIENNSKEESKGNINISLNNISSSLHSEDTSGKPATAQTEFAFTEFLEFSNSEIKTCEAIIPPINSLSKERKRHILARRREYGDEGLKEMIKKAARSDYLNGNSNSGWVASFDWLIRPSNFGKVIEGNYDNGLNIKQHGIYRQDSKDRRRGNEVEATSAEDYKTTF